MSGGGRGGGFFGGTGGDETYLEAFVESVGTLPAEVKRTLELLKDLEGSGSADVEQLLVLQQQYLRHAEDQMMQLEVVVRSPPPATAETPSTTMLSASSDLAAPAASPSSPIPDARTSEGFALGVRVLGGGTEIVVPTTWELEQYLEQDELHEQIHTLQSDAMQKADERVAIADQLYRRLDATVQRLDRDLTAMEKLLPTAGESTSTASGGVVPTKNDLAACQVTPGSEWILAKVLHHDPNTGVYKLADEDVESNKIFHLPESQVILSGVDKLSKGDVVFAVYPDTTSFYQASVVQAPRKHAASQGAGNAASALFVLLNFVDDSDEFGVTHDKAVPLKHVIYPPVGSVLQS